MECRVQDVIATLKRLPSPKHHGELQRVSVITSMLANEPGSGSGVESITALPTIMVRAEQYARGSDRWLGWVMDV